MAQQQHIMTRNIRKLVFFILISFSHTFKNTFKKLPNKKFLSNYKYYEKVNFFQCFRYCVSKKNCNIFSYNAELQTCQISDCENDKHLDDLTECKGWNAYFLTINTQKDASNLFDKIRETKLFEVLTFDKEAVTKDVEIDVDINSIYLTICFWFRMNKYNNKNVIFTMKNDQSCAYLQVYIDENQKGNLQTDVDGTIQHSFSNKFNRAEFYHVCIVYDNGTATWYTNGNRNKAHILDELKNRIEVKKILFGKATKGHTGVCSDDEGKGFENGYLFDFNIFNRKLDESEIRLVRTGKSQTSSAVSWDDVKCNFVNVLNPVLQMRSINKHQRIKTAIV